MQPETALLRLLPHLRYRLVDVCLVNDLGNDLLAVVDQGRVGRRQFCLVDGELGTFIPEEAYKGPEEKDKPCEEAGDDQAEEEVDPTHGAGVCVGMKDRRVEEVGGRRLRSSRVKSRLWSRVVSLSTAKAKSMFGWSSSATGSGSRGERSLRVKRGGGQQGHELSHTMEQMSARKHKSPFVPVQKARNLYSKQK